MLRILLCAVLILSGSIVAEAATLRAVRIDKFHYKLTGSINEDDISWSYAGPYTGLKLYYSAERADYFYGDYQDCNSFRSYTVARINSLLASGVTVVRYAIGGTGNYFSITCGVRSVDGYLGVWLMPATIIPPVDENSPNCSVSVASVVDLGSVTVGSTAKRSLQGQIRCDKSATVNVQLTNPQDKTAPAGTLKIDDATLQYDVDGVAAGKNYSVPGNGSTPFNLNFNLTDSGKTPGGHSGNLVLLADVV